MRHLLLASALFAASLPAAAARAPASASDPHALASVVSHWMDAAHIRGAAIAHVRKGRVESVQVYGERAPGVPMTADAEFNVASLTKPVFATLVLELVAEGKLSLDTPLANYWVDPDIATDDRRLALTPRLTLSHQSGLPNWRNGRLSFEFAPGTRQEYSGEGYEYTRRAIERLTGESLGALMTPRVLAKAGMTHTYFGWDPALEGHEVAGFDDRGQPLDNAGLRERTANAAANMFTTVEDYARFAQWMIGGGDLPKSLRKELARSQAQFADPAEYFGLGWRLVQVGRETVLSHDGRERGVRTQVFVLPRSREALVILTNSNQGELLTHPVVEATLARGEALMQQIGVDTWKYLLSVPAEQMQPMVQGISRSPSFMSKLLYAVDATLVAQAGLSAEEREQAHRAIDPFVSGMAAGRIDPEAAREMFTLLMQGDEHGQHLHREFTAEQARAWSRALLQADVGRAG